MKNIILSKRINEKYVLILAKENKIYFVYSVSCNVDNLHCKVNGSIEEALQCFALMEQSIKKRIEKEKQWNKLLEQFIF
jgi:hypothetical protein